MFINKKICFIENSNGNINFTEIDNSSPNDKIFAILAKKSEVERKTISLNGNVRKVGKSSQVSKMKNDPAPDKEADTKPTTFST